MIKMNGFAAIDSVRLFCFWADKAVVDTNVHSDNGAYYHEKRKSERSKCMYTCESRSGVTGISLQNSK